MGLMYLNWFDLAWDVVDFDLMGTFPNRMRAGLQLADKWHEASRYFARHPGIDR